MNTLGNKEYRPDVELGINMGTTAPVAAQKLTTGLSVLLRSAALALAYERCRAPHPLVALREFVNGQRGALTRLLHIGLRHHIALSELELECAQAGLGYPEVDGGSNKPPWCLPDKFAVLSIKELPPHPLIDPIWLSRLLDEQPGTEQGALLAIRQLLSSEGLSSRWIGISRVGDAELPLPGNARVAVCVHLFYPELWPILRAALEAISEPWDLYISVPNFACSRSLAAIVEEHPSVRFLPCVNRGRDVLPFLRWIELRIFDRYDAVCKLHSKRSPHLGDGARWLTQVLHSLLPDTQGVNDILARIRGPSNIGLIGPQGLQIDSSHPAHLGGNQSILEILAKRAALPQTALASSFFAGTMFWFRPAALDGLRAMVLREDEFPIEVAQADGTPAHALERLIWPLVEKAGFRVEVAMGDAFVNPAPRFMASSSNIAVT